MSQRFDLTGRVALITGGSKGLGKAMARGLAEAGADIVISSRTEAELRSALADILVSTHRRGRYIVADMAQRDQVQSLARTAVEFLGRVDILVNNAGTNKPQAIDAISDEAWDQVLEINLSSVMALTRALVPQMKERRWGRIIHISSTLGFVSKEKRNVYSATKAAVLGLARQRHRPRHARHHGELHRAGPVPDRSADEPAVRGGEAGVRRAHRVEPLGPAGGVDRTGAPAGQRRR